MKRSFGKGCQVCALFLTERPCGESRATVVRREGCATPGDTTLNRTTQH